MAENNKEIKKEIHSMIEEMADIPEVQNDCLFKTIVIQEAIEQKSMILSSLSLEFGINNQKTYELDGSLSKCVYECLKAINSSLDDIAVFIKENYQKELGELKERAIKEDKENEKD